MSLLDSAIASSNLFVGEVVDNNDPTNKLRVKIRVELLHQGIETSALPWASQLSSGSFGSSAGVISVPSIGSSMIVMYINDDQLRPIYVSSIKLSNTTLDNKNDYKFADNVGNSIKFNSSSNTLSYSYPNTTITSNTNINGNINLSGDLTMSGNFAIIGSLDITGSLIVNGVDCGEGHTHITPNDGSGPTETSPVSP